MENFYRTLVPIAFWLGVVAFGLALVTYLVRAPFLLGITAGGILRGAQALFLGAVAAYCAYRTTQRS